MRDWAPQSRAYYYGRRAVTNSTIDGSRNALAVVRPALAGKIRAQPHGDLALDGDVHIVVHADGHGAFIEEAIEDRAGAGMVQPH